MLFYLGEHYIEHAFSPGLTWAFKYAVCSMQLQLAEAGVKVATTLTYFIFSTPTCFTPVDTSDRVRHPLLYLSTIRLTTWSFGRERKTSPICNTYVCSVSRTYAKLYRENLVRLCGMFSSQLCLCVAKICMSECMNHHCTLPWWRNWIWSRTYLWVLCRVEIVSFGLYVGEMHLVWRVSSPNYKIECFPQKVSISWESKRSPIFRYLQPIQRQYTYFCSYMNLHGKEQQHSILRSFNLGLLQPSTEEGGGIN